MLVYVALFLSLVSVINADATFAKCYRSNNAGLADFKKFVSNGESNHNLNCAFRCIDDHYNMLRPDGTYDPEQSAKGLGGSLGDAVKTCATNAQPSASDPCQVSYNMHKCMLDSNKEKYSELIANVDKILSNF